MFDKLNTLVQYYSGKKYSMITGSGTSSIYLALKASNIPKGSKIAVPNISCPDPVYALIWAGYEPVFIDVNTDDYNINIKKFEKILQQDENVKAVIAVHLFGNSCDILKIKELCNEYNLFLVEDCAQSLGNEINEGKLGSFGDVSIFSFGNGKIIESGHGGSVQSNDEELISNIYVEHSKLPKYDQNKIYKLGKIHRYIYYKLYYLGVKTPSLNILNLVYVYFFKSYYLYQFKDTYLKEIITKFNNFKLDKENRVSIVDQYIDSLSCVDNVKLPSLHNKENILSRFTIVVSDAEQTSEYIRDKGIPSNTMYPMLVDRFQLNFNKNFFEASYKLRNSLLNIWTTTINHTEIEQTIKILKEVK
jgi:dTDP-4-amino-4,6-dideoxygalactose transaminase